MKYRSDCFPLCSADFRTSFTSTISYRDSQVALAVKKSVSQSRRPRKRGWIPGLGRSPAERNGNPLQYPWLENSMDRGTWRTIVHLITKSWI